MANCRVLLHSFFLLIEKICQIQLKKVERTREREEEVGPGTNNEVGGGVRERV